MNNKQQAFDKIKELVDTFEKYLPNYKLGTFNETQTRIQFVDPFWEALGWDMNNKQGLPLYYQEVIHEAKLKIGKQTKAPDYCFQKQENRRFFYLETKKPSINIKEDEEPAFQLRKYGWNGKLKISILTDFEEFAIYNVTKKPKTGDLPKLARLEYFTYKDYLTKFDFIWDLLARESVFAGSIDRYVKTKKEVNETETVDKVFLKTLEEWRSYLATNISLNNSNLEEHELNFAVQQTIDRILFLKIAEDRFIEPKNQLKDATKKGNLYLNISQLFREADQRYNSGLFDFKKDTITPQLKIDNKTIREIIEELYDSYYDFSIIPVEILGYAYEQFLGKVITFKPIEKAQKGEKIGVVIQEKPEVRKAGGVFYTPQYIVDYIVENTVGKLIEHKTPEEIKKIKILDPSCGSGSFLLGAYDYLLKYHLNYYYQFPPKKNSKNSPITPDGNLTTAVKKEILLNNIFGADIDQQAVEVSKLSLLIKCLEGETIASIKNQMAMFKERVLPTLDNNIVCGNSLIAPDFYENTLFLTPKEMRKVNVFDWQVGFKSVFQQGGFDAVIGNPPYVKIQVLQESQPAGVIDYFKNRYASASSGNFDIYVMFVEKALRLLNPNGKSGYILPHKFFNSNYGESLRKLISKRNHISEIVYFGDKQIFDGATTYTCLLFLDKKENKNFNFIDVKDLANWQTEKVAPSKFLPSKDLSESEWNFNIGSSARVLEKIEKQCSLKLGDISKIFVGIQTSADPVYILTLKKELKTTYEVYSKETKKSYQIEKEIVKPLLKGSEIKRYEISGIQNLVIFPYKTVSNKIELIKESEFETNYPLAWKYLLENKIRLLNRSDVDKINWWHYPYPKNLLEMSKSKILTQVLAKKAAFTYDEKADFCFVGGGNAGGYGVIINEKYKISPLYLIGLLNSVLLDEFLKNVSTTFRGGFYSYAKRFIEKIPIKIPDFQNKTEKKQYDEMVVVVEQLLDLHKKVAQAKLDSDKQNLIRIISYKEKQINDLVYQLYELTTDEIKLIEG